MKVQPSMEQPREAFPPGVMGGYGWAWQNEKPRGVFTVEIEGRMVAVYADDVEPSELAK